MEESTGEGGLPLCPGFVHNLCKDAQVRRTFVLPQYTMIFPFSLLSPSKIKVVRRPLHSESNRSTWLSPS